MVQASETLGLLGACGWPVYFVWPCHWYFSSYRIWPGWVSKINFKCLVNFFKAQKYLLSIDGNVNVLEQGEKVQQSFRFKIITTRFNFVTKMW